MHMLETVRVWSKLDSLKKHEILSQIYKLTEAETDAYFHLLTEDNVNVNELAMALEKDRTTAQRILAKLVNEQLAHRKKINLANGGIKYIYEAVPFYNIKHEMIKRLDAWHSLSKTKIYEL